MLLGKQLTIPRNPIEFTQELAMTIEFGEIPTEEKLQATVNVMNKVARGSKNLAPYKTIIVHALEAYELPIDSWDSDRMSESEVMDSRLEADWYRGIFTGIQWFGSMTIKDFGVRLYDVDRPISDGGSVETVFLPVMSIESYLQMAS